MQVAFGLLWTDSATEAVTMVVPQLIAVCFLLFYAWEPLMDAPDGRANIHNLDGFPKKVLPVCLAGIAASMGSAMFLPAGTFKEHPAAADATTTVMVSSALLPLAALVFQIFVILLARFIQPPTTGN